MLLVSDCVNLKECNFAFESMYKKKYIKYKHAVYNSYCFRYQATEHGNDGAISTYNKVKKIVSGPLKKYLYAQRSTSSNFSWRIVVSPIKLKIKNNTFYFCQHVKTLQELEYLLFYKFIDFYERALLKTVNPNLL